MRLSAILKRLAFLPGRIKASLFSAKVGSAPRHQAMANGGEAAASLIQGRKS